MTDSGMRYCHCDECCAVDPPEEPMPDDVLAEVKAALVLSDGWRAKFADAWPNEAPPDGSWECYGHEQIRDVVRALVERCEQAESRWAKLASYAPGIPGLVARMAVIEREVT